jgi:hypothetical protein
MIGMFAIRLQLVTLALVLLLCSPALSKERPLLAVLDFDVVDSGLNYKEATALTEDVRKVALDQLGGRYDIITRENLVDLLRSHGKSLDQCQGECETETGRLIGAELVVTGGVARVFGKYKLTIKVHQTNPPKLLAIQDATTKQMDALPGLLHKAAEKLLEEAVPSRRVRTGRRASKGPDPGDEKWDIGSGESAFVTFLSDPPGAEVWVDGKSIGKPLEGKTGVTRRIPRGKHTIEMALTLYKPKAKTLVVGSGRETVELELDPNFAKLNLTSKPSGQPVFIDGDEVGKTPIRGRRLIAGPHDLRIESRCYFPWTQSLMVEAEEPIELEPSLKPKMAAIELEVRFDGDDVPAVLWVDGKELGPTPGPHKVSVCSKEAKVVPEDELLNSWTHALELEHREVWRETAEVSDQASVEAEATAVADREALLGQVGGMLGHNSFRLMGEDPGARVGFVLQSDSLDRMLMYGVDFGWSVGPASRGTMFTGDEDDPVLTELAHRRHLTLHLMAGLQTWHQWGGVFVRGLYGWHWSSDREENSMESDNGVYRNHSELTQMGAEVGARFYLGDPGMSLEVGFARFDEGEDWMSIGYAGGLGEDVDSSSASLTFLGGLGFVIYGIIVPILAL